LEGSPRGERTGSRWRRRWKSEDETQLSSWRKGGVFSGFISRMVGGNQEQTSIISEESRNNPEKAKGLFLKHLLKKFKLSVILHMHSKIIRCEL
jgi:hypothetical protein